MKAPRGLGHRDEERELAKFFVLALYERNVEFMTLVVALAARHLQLLEMLSSSRAFEIQAMADAFRSWMILRFTERSHSGAARYRMELTALCSDWGLDTDWARQVLNRALITAVWHGWQPQGDESWCALNSIFIDEPGLAAGTAVLPHLLMQHDAPKNLRTNVWQDDEVVAHYDPRFDRWPEVLRFIRLHLGRRRLSSRLLADLAQRQIQIEDAMLNAGFMPRPKPGNDGASLLSLARRCRWTYLAIYPPHKTTPEIIQTLKLGAINTQFVDREIKRILVLLNLPSR